MALRIPASSATTAEAVGPFRTYLLSRGLELSFSTVEARVVDGVGSSISIPIDSELNEWDLFPNEVYVRYLIEVQDKLGVQLVGFNDQVSTECAFRVDEQVISAGWLGEALLGRLLSLENLISLRVMQQSNISEVELRKGREITANIEDNISYGKSGLSDVELLIDALRKTSIPIVEAYFIFNATNIAEDMRHALQAACHHFQRLNLGVRNLNEVSTESLRSVESNEESWERRLYSSEVDALSYSYTSAVVSCYTALDLLYEYFIYLTREPFLNPEFPSNLHFPDAPGRKIFQKGGGPSPTDPSSKCLPYAIANLKAGQFASLRNVRNSLVHNMASDSLRPRVYLGRKLPPVNYEALQYVQYLSRDVDAKGKPVSHPWIRRFYERQSDAQNSLLDWMELTWQCAFDTIEWLISRWSSYTSGP